MSKYSVPTRKDTTLGHRLDPDHAICEYRPAFETGKIMGKLLGIATREAKRSPMVTHREAMVDTKTGVGNDSRGKAGKRQITVLSREAWEAACAELGQSVDWTVRRANLFVDGVDLKEKTGSSLTIGSTRMEITGECDPCYRMDEQVEGLSNALKPHWRGGVLCRVVDGGTIRVGDSVDLQDEE